jgi:hypothetical protein
MTQLKLYSMDSKLQFVQKKCQQVINDAIDDFEDSFYLTDETGKHVLIRRPVIRFSDVYMYPSQEEAFEKLEALLGYKNLKYIIYRAYRENEEGRLTSSQLEILSEVINQYEIGNVSTCKVAFLCYDFKEGFSTFIELPDIIDIIPEENLIKDLDEIKKYMDLFFKDALEDVDCLLEDDFLDTMSPEELHILQKWITEKVNFIYG